MFICSLLLALIFREFYSLPHQLLTQLDEIHGNPRGSHIIAKIFDEAAVNVIYTLCK